VVRNVGFVVEDPIESSEEEEGSKAELVACAKLWI